MPYASKPLPQQTTVNRHAVVPVDQSPSRYTSTTSTIVYRELDYSNTSHAPKDESSTAQGNGEIDGSKTSTIPAKGATVIEDVESLKCTCADCLYRVFSECCCCTSICTHWQDYARAHNLREGYTLCWRQLCRDVFCCYCCCGCCGLCDAVGLTTINSFRVNGFWRDNTECPCEFCYCGCPAR